MAEIESYCDSEDEVFFGPLTEKERLISENLRIKTILSKKDNMDLVSKNYVGGDEGLHALAEAASMLSITSGEAEHVKEEVLDQGTMVEEVVDLDQKLSSVKGNAGIVTGKEGSHMELDAVKFLTKHIPEQQIKAEAVNEQSESMDDEYQSPGIPHHTSLASPVDDSTYSLNGAVNTDLPVDSFLVLEAQCKIEEEMENDFNLKTVNTDEVNLLTMNISEKLNPIYELEQLPPLQLSPTEWQNVDDRSDFEIKLSDNEEEIEKVERNLKVEEIIKFLADEDTKAEKENCLEFSSKGESDQKYTLQDGNLKSNVEDDDILIIKINDNEIVDISDGKNIAQKMITSIRKEIVLEDQLDTTHTRPFGGAHKKEVSSFSEKKEHNKISSVNSKYVSNEKEMVRRLKTPSKVLHKPVNLTNSTKIPKQPIVGDASKRHPGTSHPLESTAPGKSALYAHTPLKSISSTAGSHFKTPNSKTKTLMTSKIPHLSHLASPCPRKNKFADVVSPVAQYIHGNPSLLVSNKNTKDGLTRKLMQDKIEASEQMNAMDRDSENTDMNNLLSTPIPSNINYQSALPVKIFTPSPSKSQIKGIKVAVSKHIGRVKLSSLKSGDTELPLAMQYRESLIPDGELSILLTKEMGAEYPST